MTVTPPPRSTPNIWPIDDEVYAIDQKIADLQRTADQAQTSSAVAASEVAIAQKAIRDLSTAKSEILEKGRLWERDAQLQRALAERRLVAERVRLALAPGGILSVGLATLETNLKPKLNLAPTALLTDVGDEVDLADKKWKDLDKEKEDRFLNGTNSATSKLAAAEEDYATKAALAEKAWDALFKSARSLEERFLLSQKQLEEAIAQTAAADPPKDEGLPPKKVVARSAAEAGLAWKDFKDTYTDIDQEIKNQTVDQAWATTSEAAKNALAVLLTRRREFSEAQQQYQQRQASRPGRTPNETADAVDAVLKKLNPP
jgi:hypothetical protein